MIQSVDNRWKLELEGGRTALFTDDSRRAIVFQGGDSLCGYKLGGSGLAEFCITNVSGFEYFRKRQEDWLAYRLKGAEKKLVLRNIQTDKEEVFVGVENYKLNKEGTTLVFKREEATPHTVIQSLNWVDISGKHSGKPKVIGESESISDFRFDNTGKKLAFVEKYTYNKREMKSIWYYSAGMDTAVSLVDNNKMNALDSSWEVNDLSNFNIAGERLFFSIKERNHAKEVEGGVAMDIWSTTDAKLQPQQLLEKATGQLGYMAVVDIQNKHIIRLQNEGEEFRLISNKSNDDWGIVVYNEGDQRERYWNNLSRPLYHLVSVKTGERKQVRVPFYGISPGDKYLVGEDSHGNMFTYELATGVTYDVTGLLPLSVGDAGNSDPSWVPSDHRGLSFWGYWLEGDEAMLIYDRYDIWQLDPKGISAPVNLTNGYGRRNNVTFRFIDNEGTIYKRGDRLILAAFDNDNRHNGFYAAVIGNKREPDVLTMGPYIYYAWSAYILEGMRPAKARDAVNYVVWRCSAREAPNYFLTKDFKQFLPLSHVYPERAYNWLQSELVTFCTLDGRKEQGVLYKPESFDPHQKYPVIIHYYESKSDWLNQYIPPDFSDGGINISYFVSQGYLVFIPDIHYTIGEIGESAYSAIAGARNYLVGQPWTDSSHVGISGRSFGGYETNYVITRSNLFAAACADAGVVNNISQYGNYVFNSGMSLQEFCERGQNRMGASLWGKPDLYIKNSPIFQVDKVTTPVLVISNKLDAIVHFEQGVQLFTSLYRLGKRAWLLQYDEEQHSLHQRKNEMDLTIRITQFFDHYLKEKPAPEWMNTGVPAKLKGVDRGLQ